jgi:uncharacterized membrane protein
MMVTRAKIAAKGVCMGIADIIPGVSGGTMALILGIYSRLIAAISAIGPQMLPMLFRKAFWSALFATLIPGKSINSDTAEAEAGGHLGFLINLILGVMIGALVGVKFLPGLMDRYPEVMRAFFMGLVLASVVVPYVHMKTRVWTHAVVLVIAIAGTYWVVGLDLNQQGFATAQVDVHRSAESAGKALELAPHTVAFATDTEKKLRHNIAFQPAETLRFKVGETVVRGVKVRSKEAGLQANIAPGSLKLVLNTKNARDPKKMESFSVTQTTAATGGTNPSLLYVALCGAIAICAMILPGISGAFLLLLLGIYGYILHLLHSLVYQGDSSGLAPLAVFIAAMVVGILLFSRLLNWLLSHCHDATMAALAGLMVGSLRVLWPFKGAGGNTDNIMPQSLSMAEVTILATFAAGAAIVLVMHFLTQRKPAKVQDSLTA